MVSKTWYKWTYLWNRNKLTCREFRLVVVKGEGGHGGRTGNLGLEMWATTEWISNNIILCSIGNYIQYPVINHSEWKSLSHVWLCNSMDYSPPGSSVHGILQARILEWAAIPFSRGSSQPREWMWVSHIASKFFTIWTSRGVECVTYHFFRESSWSRIQTRVSCIAGRFFTNWATREALLRKK